MPRPRKEPTEPVVPAIRCMTCEGLLSIHLHYRRGTDNGDCEAFAPAPGDEDIAEQAIKAHHKFNGN